VEVTRPPMTTVASGQDLQVVLASNLQRSLDGERFGARGPREDGARQESE